MNMNLNVYEDNSMASEWNTLLKQALQVRSYGAIQRLLTLSKYFIDINSTSATTTITTTTTTTATTTRSNGDCRQKSYHVKICAELSSDHIAHNKSMIYTSVDENMVKSYYTVLAVNSDDARIMSLFHKYNYSIEYPHELNCKCPPCRNDQLGQSKKRINTMQALSHPIWIGLTSNDPFLTSFKISKKCRKYRAFQDCYENVYNNIIKQNKDFCCALLDHIENEAEVQCLMQWNHEKFNPFSNVKDLDFVRLGIRYNQKEVVSHSVPQHVIASIVNEGVPGWKTGKILYRMFIIIMIGLSFPITSMIHIIQPNSSIGQFAVKPLVKFINGAASFIIWLLLVAYLATKPKSGLRVGDAPTVTEILIFIWLVSLMVQETRELIGIGKREYFGSGWNWIDINMIALMMAAYALWTAMYFVNPLHEDKSSLLVIRVADSLFGLAIIFSYFRMVYLCQITRYLGLLQLCLGRMIQVILQFLFISFVVLGSFSVGMVFFFHASAKYEERAALLAERQQNGSFINATLSGGYNGFVTTMITLCWASFNMIGRESLEDLEDGTLIQVLSFALFTMYHGITMIVLLNMLIAMMSNSYQQIENNIEVEHKYARTHLWLQYIGDNNRLACPFNLLPSFTTCKKVITSSKCWMSADNIEKKKQQKATRINTQKERYKGLCKKLMQRYIQHRYRISLNDIGVTSPGPNESSYYDDDPFYIMVNAKVKTWTDALSAAEGIEHCNTDDIRNGTHSQEIEFHGHEAEILENLATTDAPDTRL